MRLYWKGKIRTIRFSEFLRHFLDIEIDRITFKETAERVILKFGQNDKYEGLAIMTKRQFREFLRLFGINKKYKTEKYGVLE